MGEESKKEIQNAAGKLSDSDRLAFMTEDQTRDIETSTNFENKLDTVSKSDNKPFISDSLSNNELKDNGKKDTISQIDQNSIIEPLPVDDQPAWLRVWLWGIGATAIVMALFAYQSENKQAVLMRTKCRENATKCRNLSRRGSAANLTQLSTEQNVWSNSNPLNLMNVTNPNSENP